MCFESSGGQKYRDEEYNAFAGYHAKKTPQNFHACKIWEKAAIYHRAFTDHLSTCSIIMLENSKFSLALTKSGITKMSEVFEQTMKAQEAF